MAAAAKARCARFSPPVLAGSDAARTRAYRSHRHRCSDRGTDADRGHPRRHGREPPSRRYRHRRCRRQGGARLGRHRAAGLRPLGHQAAAGAAADRERRRRSLRRQRGGDRARLRLPQRRAAPCRAGDGLARAHRLQRRRSRMRQPRALSGSERRSADPRRPQAGRHLQQLLRQAYRLPLHRPSSRRADERLHPLRAPRAAAHPRRARTDDRPAPRRRAARDRRLRHPRHRHTPRQHGAGHGPARRSRRSRAAGARRRGQAHPGRDGEPSRSSSPAPAGSAPR